MRLHKSKQKNKPENTGLPSSDCFRSHILLSVVLGILILRIVLRTVLGVVLRAILGIVIIVVILILVHTSSPSVASVTKLHINSYESIMAKSHKKHAKFIIVLLYYYLLHFWENGTIIKNVNRYPLHQPVYTPYIIFILPS